MNGIRENWRRSPTHAVSALVFITSIVWVSLGGGAGAYDLPVEKKIFELASYSTVGGQTIKNVRMGYETYGKLNSQRDNVILIPPFFGGNSHAAGRYKPEDPFPGYWDSIIGPDKALDTNRFFIISFDGLTNPNTKDGVTVTSGPASIDPNTGKPYGLNFPTITIRDFVNVEKALIDSLGVEKVHGVMGASMGGMQAFEWAVAYADEVERIIPVVAQAQSDGYSIGVLESWMAPIRLDPHWRNGEYYGREEPIEGVKASMKAILLKTRHPEWVDKELGRRWASPNKDPSRSMDDLYAVQKYLDDASTALASKYDANHLLYQIRAVQLFSLGSRDSLPAAMKEIKAKVLLLPARNDLLFPPARCGELRDLLAGEGKQVDVYELNGPLGHLEGIMGISQASDRIARFLSD